MRSPTAINRELLLVGGGHAHALVLRRLAMEPTPGLRVTLISPAAFTPYSGMLPGLLAGHYRFEDAHIDLARLCQWADVRFLADEVTALDPPRRQLHCRDRGTISYDILSIDIGSQPELASVPGAREHAVPVKPVAGLWQRWQALQDRDAPLGRIAVVGGGAGSVEVAMAIAYFFREGFREVLRDGAREGPHDGDARVDLYCGADEVLPDYPASVRRVVLSRCRELGVGVHCGHRVSLVEAGTLQFSGPPQVAFDTLFWCTGAAAAPWIADSGLPVDERGFLAVRDTLQSTGDERVFGAGDIATQLAHPRPKAGVYAVRQGPVLAHNLRALARGRPLREHRPQRRFLSMLSLGRQEAVAERGGLSLSGRWVWRWKHRIDSGFMRRFSDLPAREMGNAPGAVQAPCGGCGAKVGGQTLREVLTDLAVRYPALLPPPGQSDDAALIDVQSPLVQSTDQLRALVDDPWVMGRIAAQHALSDLYACGARPHSALAQVTLPFADPAVLRRDLHAVLRGAMSVFAEVGCRLLGGHSMQGPELQLGFAVNGVLDGEAMLPKRGAQPGDELLLTGSLGAGALFAAHMQGQADGRDVAAALAVMQQGNAAAASAAREHGARAVTDITGFGLAGHLLEMLGETLCARLSAAALPAFAGSLEAMEKGIYSTGRDANRQLAIADCSIDSAVGVAAELLFDPQTGGGLLLALPAGNVDAARKQLLAGGVRATRIGAVTGRRESGELGIDLRL
jgi:selenide,water dikinase